MRKIFTFIAACVIGLATGNSYAKDFFDTSTPDDLMNLGVRFGVNTSNRNVNKDVFNVWNCNSWGTGIDVGIVAELNFRDWFSIEPGLFFESRSGKYTYINTYGYAEDQSQILYSQFGHDRSYSFLIPIMALCHFNVSNDIRWNLEFGPYFQVVLKNKVNGDFVVPVYNSINGLPVGYQGVNSSKTDFGFKMGSSLEILHHYLVGIHYEAGVLKPWEDGKLGGRRKAWVFSIGYNF